jgi:hypothetical protein
MSDELDLDFRPETYFRPQQLEDFLLSKVKGVAVKECLHAMRSGGGQDEVDEILRTGSVSDRHCRALESSHPMFMGGNYLPPHRGRGGPDREHPDRVDHVRREAACTRSATTGRSGIGSLMSTTARR